MFSRFLRVFSLLVILSSCGLKYTPVETPDQFEERRHKIIENYVKSSLQEDSTYYCSEAFGDFTLLKPVSYKVLDSLYELKYQAEKTGITNKDLNEQIEFQKMVIDRDTNKVKYAEDHVFSIKSMDSVQMIISNLILDHQLNVLQFSVKDLVEIPNKYKTYYRSYLFSESFIYPGIQATEEEARFYDFYRSGMNTKGESEKKEILDQMLVVMDLGYKKKTLQTVELLKYLCRIRLSNSTKELPSETMANVYQLENENGEMNGYWLILEFKSNGKLQQWYFEYDLYMRERKAEWINKE
jgi:hypothetical protein